MAKYRYKLRGSGEPCRKVHLTYILSEKEEKEIQRWAKRNGCSVREWLEWALEHGIDSRTLSELDQDHDEEEAENDSDRDQ